MNTCLHCKIEFIPSRNTLGKYCSNKCQVDYQSTLYIQKWYLGEVTGTKPGKIKEPSQYVVNHLKAINTACQLCGITNWNDKPIVLQIDHIDGDILNNTPKNLRVICPNCHSQTETYANKNNRTSGRTWRRTK